MRLNIVAVQTKTARAVTIRTKRPNSNREFCSFGKVYFFVLLVLFGTYVVLGVRVSIIEQNLHKM